MNEQPTFDRPPWHASATLLTEYAGLGLDVARSASVEQHLLACATCRTALSDLTGADVGAQQEIDHLWFDVIDAVDRPRVGIVGSVLEKLGVPDHIAKVVAATPALRLSWVVSIIVALAFAVMMAMRPEGSDAFLLVIAPLIPLAGIGTSYGVGVDPLHELVRSTPLAGSRIFLYRSLAVLVTALPLIFVASLLVGVNGLTAMAWLLPALGLVGATMALSTWIAPRLAAIAAGAGWMTLLFVGWARSARIDGSGLAATFAFRPTGQLLFAATAAAGTAIFAARLGRLDQPDDFRMEAS